MADVTTPKKHWLWTAKDLLISLAAALSLDVVWKQLAKTTIEAGAKKVGDKIVDEKGPDVLEELRLLEKDQASQEPKKNIDNLWRRYRKAVADFDDHRFIHLLSKVRPDASGSRKETLLWLNDMSDTDFDDRLKILETGAVRWLEIAHHRVSEITKKEWHTLNMLFGKIAPAVVAGAKAIGDSAETLTPQARRIRLFLNEDAAHEEDHSLLHELGLLGFDIGSAAGSLLRIAYTFIVCWPLFILLCNVYVGRFIGWLTYGTITPEATSWLPLVALLPVPVILFIFWTVHPIVIAGLTALWHTRRGHRRMTRLGSILAWDLVIAICFAITPLSNDLMLVPFLVVALIVSWYLSSRKEISLFVLSVVNVVIIMGMLFFGGSAATWAKFTQLKDHVMAASTNANATDNTGATQAFTYNPQRKDCSNRVPYDPRRDFRLDPRESVEIKLHDGCYGTRFILRADWYELVVQFDDPKPGDYVSVFCTNHSRPSRVFTPNSSMEELSEFVKNCTTPGEPEYIGTILVPTNMSSDASYQGRGRLIVRPQTFKKPPPPPSLFDQ